MAEFTSTPPLAFRHRDKFTFNLQEHYTRINDLMSVKKTEITDRGDPCADHATPFCMQKLALTLSISGGRSDDIASLRTKSYGVCVFVCLFLLKYAVTS
jgi:hypothetical protein